MLDPVTVVLEGLWSIGEINGTVGFCVRRPYHHARRPVPKR